MVDDIGNTNTDSMGQNLAVYRNIAFNTWCFFTGIIAFVFGSICVLNAYFV